MRRSLLCAVWLSLACAATSAAQPAVQRVLILRSFEYDYAPDNAFAQSFRAELSRLSPTPIDFFDVSLQPAPTATALQEEPVLNYLKSSVAGQRIDLVVTLSAPAAAFVQRHRKQLFSATPVLLAAVDRRWVQDQPLTANEAAVAIDVSPDPMVDNVLRALPDTTTIAVVLGHSPLEQFWGSVLRRELSRFKDRVTFIWFDGLSFTEMLQRSAVLPRYSAVLYVLLAVDAKGFSYTEERTLADLHRVANAPIFGLYSSQLGRGIVGGRLFPVDRVARSTADVALRILSGESPEHIKTAPYAQVEPMYDWRELQRWGISEARLPPGSAIRFREPSVLAQYRLYIVGVSVVIALETGLISLLVVARGRRRRTELALRESEQQFRGLAEQNRDLAGRLINAQEAERTRIARDLHDDVSQQLAGVSIMLSSLKHGTGTPSTVARTVTTLQDRVSTLAETVRGLSHELHPSVLQHAGLVETLRRHCADLQRDHRIAVTFDAGGDDLDSLGPDVELCLFRVAQEALTNVVRHARARTIGVQLMPTPEGIEMSIADDGIGFDAGERTGGGLGLRSIDERVRLVGGSVRVHSRTGEGTSLVLRISRAAGQAHVHQMA